MASMLGRFIRPTLGIVNKFNHNKVQGSFARLTIDGHHQRYKNIATRYMATTSNYHYHEKPQSHAHDKLWKAERYLSVALLGVIPAAAAIPHPILDYAVALSLVVHVHWGVEAIVTDYIRPSIFGPTIPKVSIALVYILSSLALGGLFMFNYTDVGITQAVRMLSKM